jgi:hypothetical protein
MATTAKPALKFNGNPISEADATKLVAAIYGDKRASEILTGLADGTYKCASVAGGHIVIDRTPAPAVAPAQ